ncbi:NAD(P)/FAD-dependent oxidoreductase [Halalkalicoccus tibetensis]|uniref:NAD(P)/FAD-dependent oxidoreductase n=1 Tax=Halalkalicoccus tibetensis TaxID=175632 RepID=A0ABD5V4S5_9EURY
MTHVAIVGAYGSAGVAVAESLADRGVELTLIDDGDPGGGLCILRGCMPSKEVLSAAAHRFQARHDNRLSGIPEVDIGAVVERKDRQVSEFAEHRRDAVHELAERENVEFIHETARFVDSHTLAVGDREIEADYVVIATGSTVNVPDLPGIDEVDPMTSADVLDTTEFPDSGIVMGFGYVGLELVPYLSEAAGMELTVIEHDERPIDEAPPGYGDTVLDLYREQFGIEVLTDATERSVERGEDGGVRMEVEHDGRTESLEADQLFAFTGRKPNLDGLGLENTDLSPEEGWVEDTMRARDDPHTFVVGDANGREPILHVAKEQGYHAADNLVAHKAGRELLPYENVVHRVIFSGLGVYPFARVGHTEESAREEGYDPEVVTRAAASDGVFKVKDVPEGLATLVVAQDGTVLGYQGLHHHADSMAKTMQIVVELGLDVRELPDRAYHPTLPEILDGLFRETSARLDG